MNDGRLTSQLGQWAGQSSVRAQSIVDRLGARMARPPFDVAWFSEWNRDLDAAIDELPELAYCSRDHFRLLTADTGVPKVHALVTEADRPLAVVSLRRRPGFWEPVTDQCVPHVTVPCVDDRFDHVLAHLGREVRIGAYQHDPSGLAATWYSAGEVFEADLTDDFEQHWKSHGRRKSINSARNRCAHMDLRLDHHDDLAWIIDAWAEQWSDSKYEMVTSAGDMRAAWPTMLDDGLIRTVTLLEDDEPAAGTVVYCKDGVATGRITGRRMERAYNSAGTRLLDVTFHTLADDGFHTFDVGGGFDYKRWWAPPATVRYNIAFVPRYLQVGRRVADRARSGWARITRAAGVSSDNDATADGPTAPHEG